jgi:CDGSH-type Zn-finger protein
VDKPTISPSPNGPYLVQNLTHLKNQKGALEAKPRMALCRCGGSQNKPFCDGTHAKNDFNSEKQPNRVPDQLDDYEGDGITIHDNRGACAHAGRCTDGLPAVFRLKQEPWIDAKGASADEIAATVSKCPSGALSHTKDGTLHRDHEGKEPTVFVSPNGPYVVTGGPDLLGTERNQGASTEHFTLCRCGGSRNKPFCDGTHWRNKFQDPKN